MTEKEIEGISKICEHIEGVGGRLIQASNLLMRRAIVHDASKFSPMNLPNISRQRRKNAI